MKNSRSKPEERFLYQQIASDLSRAIRDGVFTRHERLPSLRTVSEQYQVSLATAIQAYQYLEQQEVIEAHAKSGYFVSNRPRHEISAPAITRPSARATSVSVAQLAMSLVNESRSQGLVRLGAAVPGEEMLPLASLARSAAGGARRHWREPGRYEDSAGYAPLRQQISRLMRDAGVRCKADDIIITNGALEALRLALKAVTRVGDSVAIESPTYFGILQVIESLGLKVLELPTHAATGIDPDALATALQRNKIKACVLMPSFNNPLGSTMPEENKERVVSLLAAHNIPLIEDDVYGALSHQRPRPRAAKAYDKHHNVIYCSSFSKTVAPGLRLGWIIPARFFDSVRYNKFLDNISTAIQPQLTMHEFLARGGYQRNINRVAPIYRARLERMSQWIKEYFPSGTRLAQPQGGFMLWVELPKTINTLNLYRQALDNGIAVSPGVLFSAQGQYTHHLRLSCGVVEGERLKEAIRKLGGMMK